MKESELLTFAKAALDYSGLVYWRVANGPVLCRNGTKLVYRKSLIAGFPDLAGINKQGIFWAMELKTAKGTVRPEQKVWLKKLADSNANTCIARSPEDVLAFIERLGGNLPPSRVKVKTA